MFWYRGLQHSCPGRSESKTWHNGLTCLTEVVVEEKEVPVGRLKMSAGNRQDTVTERLFTARVAAAQVTKEQVW